MNHPRGGHAGLHPSACGPEASALTIQTPELTYAQAPALLPDRPHPPCGTWKGQSGGDTAPRPPQGRKCPVAWWEGKGGRGRELASWKPPGPGQLGPHGWRGQAAVPGTTPHGARDCFLELRGVWRVRIRLSSRHQGAPKGSTTGWHLCPLQTQGGQPCNLGRRPTKHAVGRRGPHPLPGHPPRISHAQRQGGEDAGQRRAVVILTHRHTHVLIYTLTDTPWALGRAARGEPWSTSWRPVTSNISRPRRFSCSHTGEICVNLPPNTLATS